VVGKQTFPLEEPKCGSLTRWPEQSLWRKGREVRYRQRLGCVLKEFDV